MLGHRLDGVSQKIATCLPGRHNLPNCLMLSCTHWRARRWSKYALFCLPLGISGEFEKPKTVKVSGVTASRQMISLDRLTVGSVVDGNNYDILIGRKRAAVVILQRRCADLIVAAI